MADSNVKHRAELSDELKKVADALVSRHAENGEPVTEEDIQIAIKDIDVGVEELAVLYDVLGSRGADVETVAFNAYDPDSTTGWPVLSYLEKVEACGPPAPEEEAGLQERIKARSEARHMLYGDVDFGLGDAETERLELILQDGEEAEAALAIPYLRLAASMAKRFVGARGMTFIDLVQAGNDGLLYAAEHFDCAADGVPFSDYAARWIRKALVRAVRRHGWSAIDRFEFIETTNEIIKAQHDLLGELGRDPSPEEIAERIGRTPDRVREIFKTLEKDAAILAEDDLDVEALLGDDADDEWPLSWC